MRLVGEVTGLFRQVALVCWSCLWLAEWLFGRLAVFFSGACEYVYIFLCVLVGLICPSITRLVYLIIGSWVGSLARWPVHWLDA